MSDTQKTTKAVREAPGASSTKDGLCPYCSSSWDGRYCRQCGYIPYRFSPTDSEPRYTVKLTTEGWQIKDNVGGRVLAEYFGKKETALEVAESMNRVDAAEGQGRR